MGWPGFDYSFFVLIGEKQMITWWRGYLVVASQDNKQLSRPSVG